MLAQIQSIRQHDQKKHIRSLYLQLSDGEDDSMPDHEEEREESDMDEIRNMAEELKSNLHESMFPENVLSDDCTESVFDECMNTQTRHVLFGNTISSREESETRHSLRKKGSRVDVKISKYRFYWNYDRKWLNWLSLE